MLSLTQLVRIHYATAKYAGAHLRMTRELGDLLALRVVTSVDLAPDEWECVDDATGVVLHSGTFDPRCVDCDPKATGTGLPVGRCRGHRPAYQAAAALLLYATCGIKITEA